MGSGADSPCQGEMARRARGGRVGDYEHEVLIWSRPRERFAYFAAMGKVGRRPLIRHGFAVPPSPQGEGFAGEAPGGKAYKK